SRRLPPRHMTAEIASLAVILAVAFGLRFFRLDSVPQGLLVDEAYNGLDALQIYDGARPIFLTGNFGREALFMYLQALAIGLVGPTDVALRLFAAVVGWLTIPLSYLLVRKMFNRFVAVLCTAWLALSTWHIIF